ncbi:peptidase M50 [Chloroherpeton thalassium ATCC 35110]|uniref:Peptidase M50 n=1 Tax=Chloroherpeton thalassium (strain ATCC 35110 / GB-78) TaxID=517418 RepID=B3QWA7_CHLT3|nr:site-2 protease family protein [Chloroherpeton thalassium]ACF13220.1 peptidase M50 [Chloroherpeton thalassium ATCC 35110]
MPDSSIEKNYEVVSSEPLHNNENASLAARMGKQNYPVHLLLFLATVITTTLAGTFWIGKPYSLENLDALRTNFKDGLPFSLALLTFLSFHEFGHFFACVAHRVRATLPYYIPMPPISFILNIGTFGAVIRIKERIPNSKSLFDIGVSGPISGFVVAVGLLVLGFATLPPIDYVFDIHPEYRELGEIPAAGPGTLIAGKNLLYWILESLFASPNVPPMHEMYHYPLLFAGWLGSFVTALNLLPVGQLDGGHVIHAMFGGKTHRLVARAFVVFIILLGLPTFAEWLLALLAYFANFEFSGFPYPIWLRMLSWPSWIFWAFILIKFIKVDHPPVLNEHRLDSGRMAIGWISIIIFILCFTPVPFTVL